MTETNTTRDLALVGAGYWGKNLARNFHALHALHTLCDRSPEILATYGSDYSGVAKTGSYQKVLDDGAIRKVAIAAPAAMHFQLAKAALLADKDVFVEKPLCLDSAEAEELVALAETRKRILMVGHLLQYHPCVQELQRMLLAGELGRLQYITSNRLNLGKIRKEENALWSFAPHDISVILSLAGNRLPEQVCCTGESYLTPGVADTTLTSFRFAENVRAHVYVSWLNPFKEQKLTVVGSLGMAVFDDTRPWAEKLVVYRDYLTWSGGRVPTPNKVGGTKINVPEQEPLQEECRHFCDCCVARARPRTDGHEGLRVLRVLKAAQASLDGDGARVELASVRARFFSHPTAFIHPKAVIGEGTKIWHFSHVMENAELGAHCNLGQNVVVSPNVKLGRNVKVQNNVSIYTGAIIEDDVFLGPSCVLTNVSNPRSQINRRSLYESTCIRRGASVGANATIVCGTTLGRYCLIAAGAVVTKDVPDYALMVGAPARKKGWVSRHGHPLRHPTADGIYTCPESNLRYQENSRGELCCLDVPEDEALPAHLAVGGKAYRDFSASSATGSPAETPAEERKP
ncbi:MAG: Gfo/Idh/MocA family oxidoreductase [Verrucomicrobia bacterium]|nr:Gfo/Idh/MocA family oxidoreductase [Verrucomicrobiota bacterium]